MLLSWDGTPEQGLPKCAPPASASLRTCHMCTFSGPSPHPLNQKAWVGCSISLILSPLEDDDTHLRNAASVTDRGQIGGGCDGVEAHAMKSTRCTSQRKVRRKSWGWTVDCESGLSVGSQGLRKAMRFPSLKHILPWGWWAISSLPPGVRADQQWHPAVDSHWILRWPACRPCLVRALPGSLHPSGRHTLTDGVLWGLHQLPSVQIGFEALLTVWPWATCASVSLTAGWGPGLVSWAYPCSQSLLGLPLETEGDLEALVTPARQYSLCAQTLALTGTLSCLGAESSPLRVFASPVKIH